MLLKYWLAKKWIYQMLLREKDQSFSGHCGRVQKMFHHESSLPQNK